MIYMILGNGFEETEAIYPCDILRRCGLEVVLAGIGGTEITGAHGIRIMADIPVEKIDQSKLEMIILPGGGGGVASIRASQSALSAVSDAWKNGKYVAAICAAPMILAQLGITNEKKATCYPGCEPNLGSAVMQPHCQAVVDGRLITGEGPGAAEAFGLKLAEILCGKKKAAQIAAGMVIR